MTDLDLELHAPIGGHDGDADDIDLSSAITGLSGAAKRNIRTLPSAQISEFTVNSDSDKVKLHELMGTLTSSTAAGDLKKQLRNVHKRQKVLATPLNRYEQGTLARSAAYEQTSKEVARWEPIVEKNNKAEQLDFPLEKPKLKVHTGREMARKIQPFTPLEREIAILLHGSDNVLPEKSGLTRAEQRALQAMDIQEAKERRAELQRYRALLSYKESRAKRQKKIKSKTFHRILNKEKRKQEGKTLDELEEKDPEELKNRIEKAEKSRIQERMSLKHHGGSKKMKSKMIYAKYDKDARLQITDMLQQSKELRQKQAIESDSEDEKMEEPVVVSDEPKRFSPWTGSALAGQSNPWLKATKESTAKPSPYAKPTAVVPERTDDDPDEEEDDNEEEEEEIEEGGTQFVKASKATDVYLIDQTQELDSDANAADEIELKVNGSTLENVAEDAEKTLAESEEENEERNEIDDIFDPASKPGGKGKRKRNKKKGKNQEEMKAKKMKTDTIERRKEATGKNEDNAKGKKKVGKTKKRKITEVGEKSDEAVDNSGLTISTDRKRTLADMDDLAETAAADSIQTGKTKKAKKSSKFDPATNIYAEPKVDPEKFVSRAGKELKATEAPLVAESENDATNDVTQFDLIAEAFADDDVMDTFSKEKSEIEDRDKPKAIDLSLPGWGSWGGTDIPVSRRKRKKFLVKPPASEPRKDQNLKNVIISETKDKTIAKHQVSWLPRNYKNVHQFESSIRAPIGRNWNPETSFRDMTKPKVVTHMGTIIAPMDSSQKFQKQKTKGVPELQKRRKGGKK